MARFPDAKDLQKSDTEEEKELHWHHHQGMKEEPQKR